MWLPIFITTNRTFKQWLEIFNYDATLISTILNLVLHHAEASEIRQELSNERKKHSDGKFHQVTSAESWNDIFEKIPQSAFELPILKFIIENSGIGD